MAWLEQTPDSGNFKICFRWGGKKKRKSLPTADPKTAQATLLRFEENLALLERGRLELPASGDIMTFLLSDGKLSESPRTNVKRPLTLGDVVTRYLSALGNGSVEANSLDTIRLHLEHFRTKLGESFCIKVLATADLQDYIDKRVRLKGKTSILSPSPKFLPL